MSRRLYKNVLKQVVMRDIGALKLLEGPLKTRIPRSEIGFLYLGQVCGENDYLCLFYVENILTNEHISGTHILNDSIL